jgi:hypothetical protein
VSIVWYDGSRPVTSDAVAGAIGAVLLQEGMVRALGVLAWQLSFPSACAAPKGMENQLCRWKP